MPETVAVVGAGTMGAGIAQVAAAAGHPVRLIDASSGALEKAMERIGASLARLQKKGTLSSDDAQQIAGRIEKRSELAAASDAAVVIEAVFENEETKCSVWQCLSGICRADAILASNTSSISITRLAAATARPERFIGMHFFNPVPVMQLVEVVRGNRTDDAVFAAVSDLARRWGKTPVEARDFPGFISNRVLMPMLNEAMFAVYEGVGTPAAIDDVFKLGMAHPMGPLTLADFIGLDVCLDILEVLQRGFGDPKYRPCPLLRQMVAAGKLGRKSGEGFFKYQ